MTIFAAVRLKRIKTMPALDWQSKHARRQDSISKIRVREHAQPCVALNYRPYAADPNGPFDYRADFQRMMIARGGYVRASCAPVAHLLCQLSVGWVKEGGDLHDPNNPRNRCLFQEAIAWAEATFGRGSVLAARMDLDERGGAVVDLFVAPLHRHEGRRPFYSVSQALETLRGEEPRATAVLQDLWHQHCHDKLDPIIERGRPKMGVGPDRLTPEVYRARAEIEVREAAVKEEEQRLKEGRTALDRDRATLDNESMELTIAQLSVTQERNAQTAERVAFDDEKAQWKRQRTEERRALSEEASLVRSRAYEEAEAIREQARREGYQLGLSQTQEDERRAAAAMTTVSQAIREGRLIGVHDDSAESNDPLFHLANGDRGRIFVFAPTADDIDRAEIVEALHALPTAVREAAEQLLREKDKVLAAEKEANRLREEAEIVRDRAQKVGYRDGRRIFAEALPAVLRRALRALMDGDLICAPDGESAALTVVAATEDESTLTLARAVRETGLDELLVSIEKMGGMWVLRLFQAPTSPSAAP
jgi:hypothetical protein